MAAAIVFVLCGLTCLACAILLARGYRRSKSRLLLWSTLCFAGLAVQHVILFVDLVMTGPTLDLSIPRNVISLASLCLLVFGLVWEGE